MGGAEPDTRVFPGPDHVGWWTFEPRRNGRFMDQFGEVSVLREGPTIARMRVTPHHGHTNLYDAIHGGALLALIDSGMYLAARLVMGERLSGGVTLELTNHFTGTAWPDRPLDVVGEFVRETGRLVFMRGVIEQDDQVVSSYSGILRKTNRSE